MSPRRTRRGVIKHNDNSTPDTAKKTKKNVISPKETPPKRRRTTRAGKAKPISDTEENRTKSVTKKSIRKKPVKSDDSLITEDESFSTSVSSKNTTRQKNTSLISEDESPINSSQTVTSLKRMNTTPKSSPIAVTLSPHRSKKTPRRSPVNLGSPKTHSDTPMKLLKTPRKLVIKNSPSSSSSSDDSKLISSKKKPKTPSSSPKVSPLAKQKLATPPKKTPSPKKNSPIARKSIKRNTRRSIVSTLSAKKTAVTPRLKQTTKENSISPLKTPPVKLIKSPTKKLSPIKQSPTPKKLLSPKTRTTPSSPKVKLISPKKRTPSPSKIKLISPKKRTPSPSKIKLVSPKKKTPSPSKIKLVSPKKKTPSPSKIRLVSPKKKTPSPSKIRLISPKKTPIPVKSPKSSTKRSLVSKKISPRPAKLSLPVSKIRKSPVKTSKVAVVILEKVNSSTRRSDGGSPKSPKSLGKLSPRRSNSIGGVKNTSIQSPRNRSSSVKKIILESPPVENKSSSKRRSNKGNSRIVLSPTVSLRRSLNLTGSLEESTALLRKKSSTPKYRGRNRSGIENESEPEMSDTSLINMSDVFESDISQVEDKDKDGTYELDEPKTPGLKAKKAMKRSSPANAKKNEVESKKVRFAESNDPKKNTAKLRTGTPGHRSSLRRSSEVRSKSKSPQRVTKSLTDQNQRRRSSSVSVIEGTPRTPANKKTFNSNVNSNVKSNHKTQMASVNRLSRPRMSVASEKKADTKTPVPRKIPNFAEIHKKNFEKMESLVDAKKRIADRHVAMVNPILSGTKSMPEVAIGKRLELRLQNGVYNRFGFKLRKNEAVETMSKKPVSMTSEKKLNARRDILKGVRTNRRFELQMKSRKSK